MYVVSDVQSKSRRIAIPLLLLSPFRVTAVAVPLWSVACISAAGNNAGSVYSGNWHYCAHCHTAYTPSVPSGLFQTLTIAGNRHCKKDDCCDVMFPPSPWHACICYATVGLPPLRPTIWHCPGSPTEDLPGIVMLIFPIVALVFCDLPNSVGLENNVNIIMKPTNYPTQRQPNPGKNQVKGGIWGHVFPQQNTFSSVGIGFI